MVYRTKTVMSNKISAVAIAVLSIGPITGIRQIIICGIAKSWFFIPNNLKRINSSTGQKISSMIGIGMIRSFKESISILSRFVLSDKEWSVLMSSSTLQEIDKWIVKLNSKVCGNVLKLNYNYCKLTHHQLIQSKL